MRAPVLCSWVLIAAAIAGCTYDFEDHDPGCEYTAIVDGETLHGASVEGLSKRALPPVSGEIGARGTRCDQPGTYRFKTLAGLPPQAALLADDMVYAGDGFLIATKRHPLHRVFARELYSDPRPMIGCRRGRLRGTTLFSPSFEDGFVLRTAEGNRDVWMDADLEADLPRVGGLPRLTRGMRVVVHGKRCRAGKFYAFRLSPG